LEEAKVSESPSKVSEIPSKKEHTKAQEEYACQCGRVFENARGLNVHKGMAHQDESKPKKKHAKKAEKILWRGWEGEPTSDQSLNTQSLHGRGRFTSPQSSVEQGDFKQAMNVRQKANNINNTNNNVNTKIRTMLDEGKRECEDETCEVPLIRLEVMLREEI